MIKKIFILISIAFTVQTAFAQQEYPEKPNTLVTDYTNTLKPDEVSRLESKLVAYSDSTSTQIAIVMMKSVGSYDIGQYGTELGHRWGIGQKGKNNGILILLAIDDRKLTIRTGFGIEAAVPNAVTDQIIENDLKPFIKEGNYYAGLDSATNDLIQHLKGEYKADNQGRENVKVNINSGSSGDGGNIGIIIIIIVVIIILIFRRAGGSGGQVIGSRGGASPFWWFLAGTALGSNWGDSGGNWGGGDDSGGGGDSTGGGFGDFGGGDFGGGGSDGSW